MYAEDKEELERTNKANENYELHETELKDKVKENASRGVFKRLFSFNRPMYFVFIGLIWSLISGAIMPVFAIFFTKILFIMMSTNKDETKTGVGKYAGLIMMVHSIEEKKTRKIIIEIFIYWYNCYWPVLVIS